jgi:hypothetical protein
VDGKSQDYMCCEEKPGWCRYDCEGDFVCNYLPSGLCNKVAQKVRKDPTYPETEIAGQRNSFGRGLGHSGAC